LRPGPPPALLHALAGRRWGEGRLHARRDRRLFVQHRSRSGGGVRPECHDPAPARPRAHSTDVQVPGPRLPADGRARPGGERDSRVSMAKLRMGLVGGGRGSFIGRVHVVAAQLDLRAELVAGAFSSDPAKSKESATDFGIAPERAYASYREMIQGELDLPESERIH